MLFSLKILRTDGSNTILFIFYLSVKIRSKLLRLLHSDWIYMTLLTATFDVTLTLMKLSCAN